MEIPFVHVGDYPDVRQVDDGEQPRRRIDVQTDVRPALSDHTVDRRAHIGSRARVLTTVADVVGRRGAQQLEA